MKHTSEEVAVKLIDLELLEAHMVRQCQFAYSAADCQQDTLLLIAMGGSAIAVSTTVAPCSGACSSRGSCDEAAAPCQLARAAYLIRLRSLLMDGNAICFGRFLRNAPEKRIPKGAGSICHQTVSMSRGSCSLYCKYVQYPWTNHEQF